MAQLTINGVIVNINPYVEKTPGPQGAPSVFQSDSGTFASRTIVAQFSADISALSIVSYGANFYGGSVVVYDVNNRELARQKIPFNADATYGRWIQTVHSFKSGVDFPSVYKIRKLELIPAPQDYIAFSALSVTPVEVPPPAPTFPPPAPPQVATGYLTFPIEINVIPVPVPRLVRFEIDITIAPAVPSFATEIATIPAHLTIKPIPLPFKTSFLTELDSIIGNKIETFYDEDRVLKTVLNFGLDFQSLISNWAYDIDDPTGKTIVLKLYRELPRQIPLKTPVWISREISPPLIDELFIYIIPGEGIKIYLRPPNTKLQVVNLSGKSVDNVTEYSLYSSGAFDTIKPSDPILEQWFTSALEGAELNVDYNDYTKFVWYSSAEERLNAFKTKLQLIENYDYVLNLHSASLTGISGASITGSDAYGSIINIANQRSSILKSFDGYERFLYYDSGSAYSSSFNGQSYDEFWYNSDCTWPKINGSVAPITSASSWIETQLEIAQSYDNWNVNSFKNNIPDYLKNDDASAEFIQFLNMIGHQFDTIKLYIDAMPLIYDRESNPETGLSKDLIWNVAKSFGIESPNQFAEKELKDYTIGSSLDKIFRQFSAETWKRLLHNHVYLAKSKGTKQSLQALLNIYGLLPQSFHIRESSTVAPLYTSQSFEQIDEFSNVLNIDRGSNIIVPWSSSFQTTQIRFNTTDINSQTLLQFDNSFAVTLQPITGSSGRVLLKSGSSTVASSSALTDLYSGEFYTVQLSKNSSNISMKVSRADSDTIIEYSTTSELSGSVGALWTSPSNIYIGGQNTNFGLQFDGTVDEFRIWSELISSSIYENWVRYPGLYNGNIKTSAADTLNVKLSFNIPKNLGSSSLNQRFVPNESPWILSNPASSGSQATYTQFSASGFTNTTTYPYSYNVIGRTVVRYTPLAGTVQYDTNKVVVEDPPVLKYISGSGIPVLRHDKSMVSLNDKKTDFARGNNIVGFYVSPTDAINDSIIRSIGNINLSNFIGDPSDITKSTYADLSSLNDTYWNYYAYRVDVNRFIDYMKDLLTSLSEQAHQLSPAHSKLLTGIVLEPTILERYKVKFTTPQVTAGQYTRVNNETYNLEASPVTSQPYSVSGDDLTYEYIQDTSLEYDVLADSVVYDAILEADDSREIFAERDYYDAELEIDDIRTLYGENDTYSGIIEIADINSILADYPDYFDSISIEDYRHLAKISMDIFESGSNDYIIPTIGPLSDIGNDIGATNYFTNPLGYIGYPQYIKVRTNDSILISKGTWASGSSYNQYNYVIDPTDSNEYYVINNQSFISYIPPSFDPIRWRSVSFTQIMIMSIRQVAIISGSLSIVPTGSVFPYPVGYWPTHYSKTRDYRLGIIRHQYLGCVQSNDTTFDGGPVVESIPSTGDTLYVRSTGTQVQPSNNISGPILDVR